MSLLLIITEINTPFYKWEQAIARWQYHFMKSVVLSVRISYQISLQIIMTT